MRAVRVRRREYRSDIIVAVDGRLIKGKDVQTTVAAFKPGTQVTVNYDSSVHEVRIRVGSRI
jgi:hypothetical protein